nr:M23/M56 family metallopeptidase [uncultured Oscillibacter sp.]
MTLLERGLAGAALILAVALLRGAVGRALPRRVFGVLWWVAVLRLLLPWELPSRLSVYNFFAGAPQAAAPPPAGGAVTVRLLPGAAPTVPVSPVAGAPLPAVSPWTLVWLAGTALLAVWLAAAYLRCLRKFRTSLPAEGGYISRWRAEHPRVSVRVSDRISGPLAYGLFHPVILLPRGMDRGDETALAHILTHEYEHIRHLDGLTKLVLAGTLCVHWWNPAVWLMAVLASRDLELACDEAVVRRLGDPAAYARTLLAMEEARAGLCPRFAQSPIEERIKAMMKKKRVPALLTACALLLAVCVTTAFATSAREPDRDLAEQLEASITCENDTVSFTIPEGKAEWDLWISGRILADGMDMSVHYLEEESAARSWEPGETYRFQLAEAAYDELTINGTNGRENVDIDLLPWLPRPVDGGSSAEVEALWAETLAPYLPLGLEYTFDDPDGDGNGLRMTLRGREVRGIVDGEIWITEHTGNGLFDKDAGEVRAVYEDGVLTGLEFLSEEEQAAFTAQRESARDMVWPVADFKAVVSAFGPRANPGGEGVTAHDGIDIASFAGTDIFAVLDGTVEEAGFDSVRGNYLLVDHGDGLETLYAHCQELCVETGDDVEQGQVIAKVGSTGQSTGPHLHFEVRQDGELRDPFDYYLYGPEFLQGREK